MANEILINDDLSQNSSGDFGAQKALSKLLHLMQTEPLWIFSGAVNSGKILLIWMSESSEKGKRFGLLGKKEILTNQNGWFQTV